jgi:hypothetical protein
MKMFKLTVSGVTAILLLLFAGSIFAQDVSTDYDKAYDFKTLKTFAAKIGTSWGNQLSEDRVIAAVESELTKKGWQKTDADSADAIVMVHGSTEQKHDINTFYTGYSGWGYGGWYGYGGGGMGSTHTTVTEYKVGTLVTDIFDAKSKKLVFRGVAQDEISSKPEKNEKKITKATEKLFKNFPPGSKS